MSQKIDADVAVRRMGFVSDTGSRRLVFPHATAQNIDGRSGAYGYGAKDLVFDGLEGRLDSVRWHAEAASLGEAWLRDDPGNLELSIQRVELPRGIMLVRAESGVEIVAPHASLADMTITMHIPPARNPADSAAQAAQAQAAQAQAAPATQAAQAAQATQAPANGAAPAARPAASGGPAAAVAAQAQALPNTPVSRQMQAVAPGPVTRQMAAPVPPPALRQERWHMLDGVAGKINLTIKAKLDLPVLGTRSLDQALRIPMTDGRIDYRALADSLDWLEGTFVDLDVVDDRLVVAFKVPIFGSSRELISFSLDDEAVKMARFGKVPLRSFVDFRVGSGSPKPRAEDKKKSILRSLTLDAIEVALSMVAPRSLEVGGGTIMFGGDDAPGIVNFQIKGSINDHAAGYLRGTAGSVDTTIKDLHLGPMTLTADRFSFDRIEDLQVAFENFTPTALSATIHRVTATNLRMTMG